MVVIDLDKILNTDIYFKNIFAINLVPKLRVLNKTSRDLNGYIYVIEGEMEFVFKNDTIKIFPGCLIYLPHGSKHIYRGISKNIRYIRLDFEMYLAKTDEMIVFSKYPQLITENLDYKIIDILSELSILFQRVKYAGCLKANALLYEFLYEIECSEYYKKIYIKENNIAAKCMDFINEHFSDKISTEKLCEMYNISPTHLRRIFKSAAGCTITEYINKRRINHSLTLLKKTDMSIIDIAYSSGYESQNYFSRAFKKIIGKTPIKYRNDERIKNI